MTKEIISDELLRKAVVRAIEIEYAMYERKFDLEKEHSFSGKYSEQMKGLLAELDETKECAETKIADYSVKKMSTRVKLLLIAAIVMLLGTLSVAAEPVREFIYQLKETIFPDNTEVNYEELNSKIDSENKGLEWDDFEAKEPSYIPNDYRLEVEEMNESICEYLQIYVNEPGETIIYEQKIIGEFDTWAISSNGEPAESIAVCGDRGYLYTDRKDYHYVIYPYEGYVYSIASYEDVEVLVKCLESVFNE